MRTALGQSRNIPAIKAMYMAGIKNTQDMAKKMGVKSGVTGCYAPGKEDCEDILSTAIGDSERIRLQNMSTVLALSHEWVFISPKPTY